MHSLPLASYYIQTDVVSNLRLDLTSGGIICDTSAYPKDFYLPLCSKMEVEILMEQMYIFMHMMACQNGKELLML